MPAIPAPASPAPASSAPIVKTEAPPSPSPSVRSTIPPHKRLRPGPHKSVSTTPEMQRPTQAVAPIAVKASPVSDQHVLVNLQQSSESDQEPWVKIQEPPKVETNWDDLHGLDVKGEPEAVSIEHSSSQLPWKSEPQISKVAASVERSSNPQDVASAHNVEVLAEHALVTDQDQVHSSQHIVQITFADMYLQMTNSTRRFARNEWLPMLLSMNDTDKGRQLIRAFTDHIRAGLDTKEPEHSDPETEKGLLMEAANGQCYPATVPCNTTISELTKEFAELVKVSESDISVVLRVRVVEDHID